MKKRFITRLLSFTVALSALFVLSCTDVSEDSAPANNPEKTDKCIISVAVSKQEARTAMPSFELSDFSSFELKGKKGNDAFATIKSWNTNAYALMTADRIEIDSGTWDFTLVAVKNGTKYEQTITNKVINTGASTLDFNNLSLKEIAEGTGSIAIDVVLVDENVSAITASLYAQDENGVATGTAISSITLPSNRRASFTDVSSGAYVVVFNFYTDRSMKLRVGTCSEYAIVTNGAQSVSTLSLGNLDQSYQINYFDGNNAINLSPASYTRFDEVTLPATASKNGYVFAGWYASEPTTYVDNGTSALTVIEQGSVGNKNFYAKFIPVAETKNITSVVPTGTAKVSHELTATAYVDGGTSAEFGGDIVANAYKWQIADSTAGTWTDISGATGKTYTPTATQAEKYIRVLVKRTYTLSVVDTNGDTVNRYSVSDNETYSAESISNPALIAKGTIVAPAVVDLNFKYNGGTPVVRTTTDLAIASLSAIPTSLTIFDDGGVAVSCITRAFETGATAPSSTGAVPVILKADGYNDLTISGAVTIYVKYAAPENTTSLLSTATASIANKHVQFASNSIDDVALEYSKDSGSTWTTVDTTEPIRAKAVGSDTVSLTLSVRFAATPATGTAGAIAASEPASVTISEGNIGTARTLTKVVFNTADTLASPYVYGTTVSVTPEDSDEQSMLADTDLSYVWSYASAPAGVDTETWSSAQFPTTTVWTEIPNAIGSSFTIADVPNASGEGYATDLVGKYLRVVVKKVTGNTEVSAKAISVAPIQGAVLVSALASNEALSYANNERTTVKVLLEEDLITPGNVIVPSGKTLKEVVAKNESNNSVTVSFSFGGKVAPDGSGIKTDVLTASAHGYADLYLPIRINVRAEKPNTSRLAQWLDSDVANITCGYIKFTATAADAKLEYSYTGADASWNAVTAGEIPVGTKLFFRVKEYNSISGNTVSADTDGYVAPSEASELTSVAYTSTYIGTRSVKITGISVDNSEIGLTHDSTVRTITAEVDNSHSATATSIDSWSIEYAAASTSGSTVTITSDPANKVIATYDTSNKAVLTFDASAPAGVYYVTVYGTRDGVDLSTTITVTLSNSSN